MDGIDIWAKVYTLDKNYLIVIEDKIFSSEHSDQLTTYKKLAEEMCKGTGLVLVCVYLKTGSEPERDLVNVRSKGFATFNRKDFIGLLAKHRYITNNIFRDFLDNLEKLEASYVAYETTLIKDWTDRCWVGFYQLLEKELGLVAWNYVNPPAGGGFWNACLNWEDWNGFPVFLQIEQGGLSFKICTDPEEIDFEGEYNRSIKRNEWSAIILSHASKNGISEIIRPDRFGNGKYMTAALVRRENWLGESTAKIDKVATIERLRKYKAFLTDCLKKHSETIVALKA